MLPKKWLVLGGEALRPEVARTFLGAGTCRVLNHYGPTETTVGVLTYEVTPASLDVGDAGSARRRCRLVRRWRTRRRTSSTRTATNSPSAFRASCWLGGAGVTQGYLNRPELTVERFVDRSRATRVYRTGDRVRRLRRRDARIPRACRRSGEGARLSRRARARWSRCSGAHPGVAQGVVVLRTAEDAEPTLVAYAVPKSGGYAVSHADRPTSEKLVEWLGAQLPEYMVPSAVVLLEAAAADGERQAGSRRAAGAGAVGAQAIGVRRTAHGDGATVAKIWRDVLKKERSRRHRQLPRPRRPLAAGDPRARAHQQGARRAAARCARCSRRRRSKASRRSSIAS